MNQQEEELFCCSRIAYVVARAVSLQQTAAASLISPCAAKRTWAHPTWQPPNHFDRLVMKGSLFPLQSAMTPHP